MLLILFILGAFFHHLHGQPISSPHVPDADYDVLLSRAPGAESKLANLALCIAARSDCSIIRSCLVTILACTWKAIHPNIGAPEDTQWITFRRRVFVTVCALIAPEVMVLWAMKQHRGAKRIMNKYNTEICDKKIGPQVAPKKSIFIPDFVAEWLWESPLSEAKDGIVRWSMVHGFFLQMGGLLLYKDGQPFQVLDYKQLKKHIDAGDIDIPLVTKAEITDRSKGNVIVKGLVFLQTLGFVVQSGARMAKSLPLTELEVVTLAFAMLNCITYGLWWEKPQNVCVPIRIDLKQERKKKDVGQLKVQQDPLKTKHTESDESSGSDDDDQPFNSRSGLYIISLANPRGSTMMSMSEETLIGGNSPRQNATQKGSIDSIESIQSQSNHLRAADCQEPRKVEEYNEEWKGWIWYFAVQLPYRCGHFLCRPFSKMGGGAVLTKGKHRVPMFYAECEASDGVLALSALIATAFGLIHFLAWSAAFPSQTEKVLWRVAALIITLEPAWFTIANVSWEPEIFKRWPWVETMVVGVAMVGLPLYIFARLALLVLAFLAFRDLPQAAHKTIEWTGGIPHL